MMDKSLVKEGYRSIFIRAVYTSVQDELSRVERLYIVPKATNSGSPVCSYGYVFPLSNRRGYDVISVVDFGGNLDISPRK